MPDAISVTSYTPFSWAIAILKKYYFDKILQFKQEKSPSGLKNPSKLVDRKACFVSTHSYDFSSRNSCRLEWKVTSKAREWFGFAQWARKWLFWPDFVCEILKDGRLLHMRLFARLLLDACMQVAHWGWIFPFIIFIHVWFHRYFWKI